MKNKYYIEIIAITTNVTVYKGEMNMTQALQYMDKHASVLKQLRPVLYIDIYDRWIALNMRFVGNRRVYKLGTLYILDPNYMQMKLPEQQRWHVWTINSNGSQSFCKSFSTEAEAKNYADRLEITDPDYQYFVRESDIQP